METPLPWHVTIYTIAIVVVVVLVLEVPPHDGAPCVTGTGICAGCGRLITLPDAVPRLCLLRHHTCAAGLPHCCATIGAYSLLISLHRYYTEFLSKF